MPDAPLPGTPGLAEWTARAEREVGDRDGLTWQTPEGISIKALYTQEDTADITPGLPGFAEIETEAAA